jgi:hypothetical protein
MNVGLRFGVWVSDHSMVVLRDGHFSKFVVLVVDTKECRQNWVAIFSSDVV